MEIIQILKSILTFKFLVILIGSAAIYSTLVYLLMKKVQKSVEEKKVKAKFATKYGELLYKEEPKGFFKINN